MIQQQDSLHTANKQAAESHDIVEHAEQHALQIENDSAAKSVFTSKNHWPIKVDSVLRPDMAKPLEVKVNPLPKYYKDTYFAKDSMLHSELTGGRYGIAGDPVPYSIHKDNVLTPTIILGILILAFCVKNSAKSFSFQIKNFFHTVRSDSVLERESSSDKRYLAFIEIYTAFILALVFYFYTKDYISDTYITYSEYTLMAIYFGGMIGLFWFEHLIQSAVNKVFFPPRECNQWVTIQMTTTAWGGILLTPILLLRAYFDLSVENSLIYTLIVIVFVKLLLFYKCFQIFFKKKGAFLQIFLYFCTLEIIPPVILWGILVTIANYLKVNY